MSSSSRFDPRNYVDSFAKFLSPTIVKEIHFRHPEGYLPDISDKIFRHPSIDAKLFHVLAEGQFGSIIAAVLFYPLVDQKETSEEVPVFDPKNEEFARNEMENEKWKRVVCKSELEGLNDGYTRLLREIQFSRFHQHENIVKFYEAFPEFQGSGNITNYWLVSERMDYNMEQYFGMQGYTKVDQETFLYLIGSFLAQLLRGLDYLHRNGIIHRNIESRQIGYNQNKSQFKILNFGLSRYISSTTGWHINLNADHSTTVLSPPCYQAIEMLVNVKYNTKIDIWAAALVTIEWLGEKLFQPPGSDEEIERARRKVGSTKLILDRIVDLLGMPKDKYKNIFGKVLMYEEKPSRLSQKLVDLCKSSGLQNVNVVDVGLLDVEDFCDLLQKMLNPDQKARPSAEECLEHPFLQGLNKQLQTYALDRQPANDGEIKIRNQKHKEILDKQLLSGYTRLSF